MWKDGNNEYDDYLKRVLDKQPVIVPHCCSSPEMHYFLYEHAKKRGSAWVWCSSCRSFSHYDGVMIPEGHQNNPEISLSELRAEPVILDAKKELVDSFNRSIFPL